MIKSDTLGGLEALVKTLRTMDVPIRKAEVGELVKQDIMEMKTLPEPVIFTFNIKNSQDILKSETSPASVVVVML